MYAMLMGKLPFRSPRQGTKKRQKLLEQIQAGLSEGHEKEMSHLTREARDLIGTTVGPSLHSPLSYHCIISYNVSKRRCGCYNVIHIASLCVDSPINAHHTLPPCR